MKRAIATVSASIAAITLSAPPASAATVHFGFDEVCFVLASGEQLCWRGRIQPLGPVMAV